ncbi:MAG: helix-turn-helix transcriptional regulator [Candidatus Contendobacter sp.]|nr:helix-turn-helix transcriptional regulator [Candidatus Contendobacter sp.]
MSTVAEILTTLMVRAGLSDNELADRTGIPQPTISRIKNGNSRDPRDSTLRPLAEYFRLSVSQLRGDVPLPTDRVCVAANDQVVEVDEETLHLALAIQSLSSSERGALQALVDSLSQPKACGTEVVKKAG